MYVVPSLISQKGNNFGGSAHYIRYMVKDSDGFVFDNLGEKVYFESAILNIDNNSKGGIRNNEARWYTPVYSFSEDEALHVANSILKFGDVKSRNIKSYDDLNADEKSLYNEKITSLALEFQNQMAKNFNKQNLGIETKDDILWYGVVENKRKYTGWDNDVRQGNAKQGQSKKGFNTHVHIIQSRKALNEKKSLISPMANARSKTHQGAGFDRNIFYNAIEQTFDSCTNFKRKKTFEQYKAETKTVEYWQKRGKFQQAAQTFENRVPKYSKSINKNIERINITNEKCVDYFFQLEKRGLLEFDRKKGYHYYFRKKGQRSGSIAVSDKGWIDFSDETKGGILKAIQIYDKFDWNQSVALINSLTSDYSDVKVREYERKLEVIKELSKDNLLKFIDSRGITLDLAKKYLKQVHYTSNENQYYSIGFRNNSGGYVLRGENFKSNLGVQDITTYNFDNNNNSKNVLIFEGFFNYLSYLKIYNKTTDKVIIMNSTGNYKKMINYINSNAKNFNFLYYGDNDWAGDTLLNKLIKDNIKVEDKRYLYTTNDLNSYIVKTKFNNNDINNAIYSKVEKIKMKKNI